MYTRSLCSNFSNLLLRIEQHCVFTIKTVSYNFFKKKLIALQYIAKCRISLCIIDILVIHIPQSQLVLLRYSV